MGNSKLSDEKIIPLLWGKDLKTWGTCSICGIYSPSLYYQVEITGVKASAFTSEAMCRNHFASIKSQFLYATPMQPKEEFLRAMPTPVFLAGAQHTGTSAMRTLLFQAGFLTPADHAMRGADPGPFGENRWAMELGVHSAAKAGKQPHTFTPDDDLFAIADNAREYVDSFGSYARARISKCVIGHPHMFFLAHLLTKYGKVIVTTRAPKEMITTLAEFDIPDPLAFVEAVAKYTKELSDKAENPSNLLVVSLADLRYDTQMVIDCVSTFLKMPMPRASQTHITKE